MKTLFKRVAWALSAALAAALAFGSSARADTVNVAVAANFTAPMQKIAQAFAQDTGHQARLAFGSTGALYAQIKNGAPFDLLLAADDETPERLEKEGLGVVGTRFTYAIGKLVLWSKNATLVDAQGEVLRTGNFDKLAIANPKTAPYGAAAVQTLTALGVAQGLQAKLVQGESVAQTLQFVSSGNAALGFVALSQVGVDGKISQGSAWVVPEALYAPLKQDALLLTGAKDKPAAQALLRYLRGERARTILKSYGYTW